jgi:hypothetical protein
MAAVQLAPLSLGQSLVGFSPRRHAFRNLGQRHFVNALPARLALDSWLGLSTLDCLELG